MNINKYEAAGISLSVVFMVLALFLIRVDSAPETIAKINSNNQAASIVVANDGDHSQALGNALDQSKTKDGKIGQLIIDDVVIGDGKLVNDGDTVTVHYVGTLQNGQQFEDSKQKGQPFTFEVGAGKAIAGWDEGVLGMREGGSRVLVVPSDMAYGKEGLGPIPGDATLVFVIELLEVK